MSNITLRIETSVIGTEPTKTVDARELHKNLGVRKDFSDWIKGQINNLGLEERVDFKTLPLKGVGGKFDSIDYTLTLDTAKHISMASRTPRGKQVRNYFIEAEKNLMKIGEAYQSGSLTSDDRLMALIETQTTTLSQMMIASQQQSEMMMQAMNMVSRLDRRISEQSSIIEEMAVELIKQDKTITRMRDQVSNANIITKDLNSYLRYQPLSREEKKRLGFRVTNRAKELCENYGVSLEVATRSVWGLLNKRFNITSYHDLKHEDFLRAYDYVQLIELDGSNRDIDENRYEPYERNATNAKNIFGDGVMPEEFSKYVDLGGIIIVDDEEQE